MVSRLAGGLRGAVSGAPAGYGAAPRSNVITYFQRFFIYTIICIKSVCRRSQTAGRNSCSIDSGDISN